MTDIIPSINALITNLITSNNLEKTYQLPETLTTEEYTPLLKHFHPPSTWYFSRIKQIDFITGRLDLCYNLTSLGSSLGCSELDYITTTLNYILLLASKNLLEVNIEDLIEFSSKEKEVNYWFNLVRYLDSLKEFELIVKAIGDNINPIITSNQLESILKLTQNKLNYKVLLPLIKSHLLNNLSLIEFSKVVNLLGSLSFDKDLEFLKIQIQILLLFNTFKPSKTSEYWLNTVKDKNLQTEIFEDLIYNELGWDDLINVLESPFLMEISNDEKFKLILNTFEEPSPQLDIWLETNEITEAEVKSLTFEFINNSLSLTNQTKLPQILQKCENWLSYLNLEEPEVIRKLEFIQGLRLLNNYYYRLNILSPSITELIETTGEDDKFIFLKKLFETSQSNIKLYLEENNLLKLSYLLGLNLKSTNFIIKLNTLLIRDAINHRDYSFSYRLILTKFKLILTKSYEINQLTKSNWVMVCLDLIKQSQSYSIEERRLVLSWATSLAIGDNLRECLEIGKSLNELNYISVTYDHPMYWSPLKTTSKIHKDLISQAYFPPSGLNLKVMSIANSSGEDSSINNLKCDASAKSLLRDLEKGLENAPKWFKLANSGKLNTMHFPDVEVPEEEEEVLEEVTQSEDNEGDGWGEEIGDLQVNEQGEEEGGWGQEVGNLDHYPTEKKHTSPLQAEEEVDTGGWGDEIGDLDLNPTEEHHTSPLQAEEEIDAGGWDDQIGDLEIDPVVEADKPVIKVDSTPIPKTDTNVDADEEDNNGWDDEVDIDLPAEDKAPQEASALHDKEEDGWKSELGDMPIDTQAKSNETSKLLESYPTPQYDLGNMEDDFKIDFLPNFAKLPIDTLISIGQIPLN